MTLAVVWSSGTIKVKESLQKLIFPEGIVFDRKIDGFRTPKVNSIFSAIVELAGNTEDNKKGTNHSYDDLSPAAERQGFEPWVPRSGTTVFETAPLNHSGISPYISLKRNQYPVSLFELILIFSKLLLFPSPNLFLASSRIATVAVAPTRETPSSFTFSTSSSVRTPPAALTFT